MREPPAPGYDAGMNVLVVGATGRTGRLLAQGALERGHDVTALVRAPEKLGDLAGRVRVVAGDVLDGGVVSDAVDGQDAVLVALSAAHRRSAPAVNALGTLNVIRSMQRYGVRRLVVLSASGTQPGRDPNLPVGLRARHQAASCSGPPTTTCGAWRPACGRASSTGRSCACRERSPTARLAASTAPSRATRCPAAARIARADVAEYMLDQLTLQDDIGHAVAVAY